MSAPRTLWRTLLTVFQIVTLVAFSVVAAGHSHAATGPIGHAHPHDHPAAHAVLSEPSEIGGAPHAAAIEASAQQAGEDAAASHCGLHCCHVSVLRSEGWGMAVTWRPERRLAGIPAIAFVSVSPEALPEPPRTVA
ncbi:hypothetical protein [Methylobacterium sp. Leaf118]|uniref:hypothetical protein n=1 Tax=Methylobacterium sp. Leaf118 TaxID=2876562 RepID=UPI001E64A468|nr:hypothetical protein [Methylobacterium sp. Leaf118]